MSKIKPGIIVAIIGILGFTVAIASNALTLLEKSIILLICVVVTIAGVISETSIVDRFRGYEVEQDKW